MFFVCTSALPMPIAIRMNKHWATLRVSLEWERKSECEMIEMVYCCQWPWLSYSFNSRSRCLSRCHSLSLFFSFSAVRTPPKQEWSPYMCNIMLCGKRVCVSVYVRELWMCIERACWTLFAFTWLKCFQSCFARRAQQQSHARTHIFFAVWLLLFHGDNKNSLNSVRSINSKSRFGDSEFYTFRFLLFLVYRNRGFPYSNCIVDY